MSLSEESEDSHSETELIPVASDTMQELSDQERYNVYGSHYL